MEKVKRIVVGLSGASGSIYTKVLLDSLKSIGGLQVGIIHSTNALINWDLEIADVKLTDYPFTIYNNKDFMAPFASGSANWDAMIVCPCSAGFLGRMAHGVSSDLMGRAADVMLKERKKLVLVLRETPLSLIHIENMRTVTLAGGIICPAIPSFYSKPESMEQLASTVSHRALHLAGIEVPSFKWNTQ
ncbi:MAG: UbiX family flavin prenyltransferase [Bacteroidota bacterium]|nr:UbiX family flavin prenyltransferase [Bacteroidota bacterium]